MKAVPLSQVTADLVVRARAGDQNAMGMIAAVKASADKGSPRAKEAAKALKAFIDKNPVPTSHASVHARTTMGAEARQALGQLRDRGPVIAVLALLALPLLGGRDALQAAAVTLANGPALTTKRVSTIGASIEEADRRFFYTGVHWHGHDGYVLAKMCPTIDRASMVHAGRCVGMARAIQEVRKPGSSISRFSRLAGWELGE